MNDDQRKPGCLICNDTSAPENWDGPYQAYRWSPELEETE